MLHHRLGGQGLRFAFVGLLSHNCNFVCSFSRYNFLWFSSFLFFLLINHAFFMGSLAAVLMAVKVARAKISYILITELGFSGKFEVVSLIECLFGEFWN